MTKFSLLASLLVPFHVFAQTGTLSEHLKVDQFGYLPGSEKICVINNPITGFDAGLSYTPGESLQVRQISNDSIVFTGTPQSWNSGNTYDQSGDQLWWFDFSTLETSGTYYIFDPTNNMHSFTFDIRTDVYKDVLKQAMRVFYYQRSGFVKDITHAGDWSDGASHLGALQDLDCRLASNPLPENSRQLQGGWFDAGDYNKYVNFAYTPVHDLLFAYLERPGIWTDDFDIPESGNGVPDILDELKWELDWLIKMQEDDGSVLMKVSVPEWQSASPPSADAAPRRYGPAQASATRTAASMFALAAIAFQEGGMNGYADTLKLAALDAWTWLTDNPSNSNYNNAGFTSANPEISAYGQLSAQVGAAVALFALTDSSVFRTYVDANYGSIQPIIWGSWYPFESTIQDLLLYYSSLPTATSSVATAIQNSFSTSMDNSSELISAFTNQSCGYRAYIYTHENGWGSNSTRSHVGSMFSNISHYNLEPDSMTYLNAAQGHLHFLHGVNPVSFCMLSNMSQFGAEKSVNEIYHGWFADGTDYDHAVNSLYGPAPGFVTGGFNQYFAPDPSYGGNISPPQNQPPLKSYKDWNTNWPENSWEVTEPSISYQAAYVKLLSKFVPEIQCSNLVTSSTDSGNGSLRFAIDCAQSGDTIEIQTAIDDTIRINSGTLTIMNDLVLRSINSSVIEFDQNNTGIDVAPGIAFSIMNLHLVSVEDIILTNHGSVQLENVIMWIPENAVFPAVNNQGSADISGSVLVHRQN